MRPLIRSLPAIGPFALRECVRVIDGGRFPGLAGMAGVVLGIRQDERSHYGYETLFPGGARHIFYAAELEGMKERVGLVRLFGVALGIGRL